jgi:hypothetical protein
MAAHRYQTGNTALLREWTREEVLHWLKNTKEGKWKTHAGLFLGCNGRDMSGLTKADFVAALGQIGGACLYNNIQHMKEPQGGTSLRNQLSYETHNLF